LSVAPPWHCDAAGRGQGPATWFLGRGEPVDEAVIVCAGCPVREECLDAALEHAGYNDNGIWGGTSRRQRPDATDRRWRGDAGMSHGMGSAVSGVSQARSVV